MTVDNELEIKVRGICTQLDILGAFNWVLKNNPSNDLPYHNWYHALCMIEKCVEGANYHNLPYRSVRHLAVAALFHDYAHTGGGKDDQYNIVLALRGLNNLANRSVGSTVALGINLDEVEQIIRITQYPYIDAPICIEQRIIRDADLMQSFRPTWKEMILDGLRKEMEIKLNKEISIEEMCKGQIAFLKNVIPLTDWGKHVMYQCGELDKAILRFSAYF